MPANSRFLIRDRRVAGELVRAGAPDVHDRMARANRPGVAAFVPAELGPADLVPGLARNRHENRAERVAIARDQSPHVPTQESLEELSVRGFRPPTIMIRDVPSLIHCTN
jgi:hypothetical protein